MSERAGIEVVEVRGLEIAPPKVIEVRAIEIVPLRFIVPPTRGSTRQWNFLSADMCDCPEGGFFLCHVELGCNCGVARPHSHCRDCGGILAVG